MKSEICPLNSDYFAARSLEKEKQRMACYQARLVAPLPISGRGKVVTILRFGFSKPEK